MQTVSAEEMYAYEQKIITDIGVPAIVLMEAAAQAIVAQMRKHVTKKDRILVVAGSGNNGGDAIAAGRILTLNHYDVTILLVSPSGQYSTENQIQQQIAHGYHCRIVTDYQAIDFAAYHVFLDGLFGIGLARPVAGDALAVISRINDVKERYVYAIDVPSGISAAGGQKLGACVIADETITFGFAKKGMNNPELASYFGAITIDNIGFFY